jgi:hypothetical protein
MNNFKLFTRKQIENALELTIKQRDSLKKELDRLYKMTDVIIKAAVKDD